ncbi:hypothetical protein Bpfe_009421 [Biomphalaria pfeifferi]|uniref:Uncharacterized protein n=1 Tax=Biomphalaria pfeifferi TaxID=112525 RepID=A0AAD8BWT4_BIOPF|nr:hypothetical protein Bpfe_009421 [Biomphalaria pfeifferi]
MSQHYLKRCKLVPPKPLKVAPNPLKVAPKPLTKAPESGTKVPESGNKGPESGTKAPESGTNSFGGRRKRRLSRSSPHDTHIPNISPT